MKRYLVIFINVLFIGLSNILLANIGVDSFTVINSGYLLRGDSTGAIQIKMIENGTGPEELTEIVFTSDNSDFDSDDPGLITKVDIYYDEDEDGEIDSDEISIVENASTAITTVAEDTVTLSIDDDFIASETRYYIVEFTLADEAALADSFTITFNSFVGSISNEVKPDVSATIQVLGVDASFTSITDTTMYFDADVEDFQVASFNLTADSHEDYEIETMVIYNEDATFDVDGVNEGIIDVKLYLDNDDDAFDADTDTLIAQTADNTVTFNSTTTASIDFSAIDNNSINFSDTETYFLAYDLGTSSNILEDPDDDEDSDALAFSAQVTSITGTGADSAYSYGPIDISDTTNNSFSGSVAGVVFYNSENIFPSMNVAANVTNVPIFEFEARAVGADFAVTQLVISNDEETFATNATGTNGLSKLTWYKDDGNGAYDGVDIETLVDYIDLDDTDDTAADTVPPDSNGNDSNTNDTAIFLIDTTLDLDTDDITSNISSGLSNAHKYYIVADFGAAMDDGDSVSLNIDEDTQVSYDLSQGGVYSDTGDDDAGGSVDDDGDYYGMAVGNSFPIDMDPTASITLIDSDLTILSDFTQNLDTSKLLVAGMYDIPIYTITINVFEDITDLSLEFESPDGFFNETSQGIAKLSLYLDLGTENEVCSQDVFLGSTNTFTDSNTKAVVSGISIPSGTPQRLLVAFELGQRVQTESDPVSIQLTDVSGPDVAALLPNPVTPLTYDVSEHVMKITDIQSSLSGDTTIDNDTSTFTVEVFVEALTAGNDDIQLVTKTITDIITSIDPLSTPKFYLNGVSGFDRTYEFDVSFDVDDSTPQGSASFYADLDVDDDGTKRKFLYNVDPADILSEGNYLIDFDLYYNVVDTSDAYHDYNIRLTRSKGAGVTNYQSAADLTGEYIDSANDSATQTAVSITATTSNEEYSWTLPSLVMSVESGLNSSSTTTFYNYQSIQKNSKLFVTFINEGKDVDPASIVVALNGVELKTESEVSSATSVDYYTYDILTGLLTIESMGDTSGQLTISANDNFGSAYPTSTILFYTSEANEIHDFLVYPNPYSPSLYSGNIIFGFSLTQPADVVIYVYDAMGREVTRETFNGLSMGYSTITWSGVSSLTNKYLASGTYYIKILATDDEGDVVVKTTKWAVY